jgi:hypothetical protein
MERRRADALSGESRGTAAAGAGPSIVRRAGSGGKGLRQAKVGSERFLAIDMTECDLFKK